MDTDHVRRKEIHGLAEHSGFGLDTADAPADDSEAVYHRRMRIGTDERIRKIHAVAFKNAFCKIFEIDLMNDTDSGRDDAETIERLRSPFQKTITLIVSLKFHLHISLVRGFASCKIYLDRMVDHEIDWHKRLDHAWIFAHPLHGRAHRREIDKQRHARKILQDDPCYDKRYLLGAFLIGLPRRQCSDIGLAYPPAAVEIAKNRLENYAYRHRQT